MAGDDAWVLAFMWHGLLLAWNGATNFWSSWSVQILVLFSLAVQFALTISAAIRWRGARWVREIIVWFMYAFGDYLATTALSKLSVSTTSGVHQLVALWASILLLHLGGPDNISAYSLEDNELSGRKMLEMSLRVLGALYVTISISGSRKLVVAARWILFLLGVFKYLEKAIALRRANLGNMRKSVMKERRAEDVKLQWYDKLQWDDKPQSDDDLLLKAHSLFHICLRAMVDSSIMSDVMAWKNLNKLGWEDTWKVMEMELSLMYDILYTKASVIHTWHGYLIRLVSPIATLIALVLFELSNEAGWSGVDVWITRILLVSTFFLETVSLLSALGSSWTGAILYQRRRGWLEHAILCNRRWHRFRRGLVSLRRFVSAEGCREWSGTIGQHNMLRSCKRNRDMKDRLCSLAKKMGVEWCKDEHYYLTEENARPSMKLVFDALLELLWVEDTQDSDSDSEHSTIQNTGADHADAMYSAKLEARVNTPFSESDPMKTEKPAERVNTLGLLKAEKGGRALNKMEEERPGVVKDLKRFIRDEIHEGILIWHIATDVYLYHRHRNHAQEEDATTTQVEAIKVLSNYMMFLLVEHPYMLPGLVLRKLYEVTRDDLAEIWRICATVSNRAHQHDNLTRIFMDALKNRRFDARLEGRGLMLASKLAEILLKLEKKQDINCVKLVFDVWVEMLLYASHRCSRESHAKKLSTVRSGAELATVVWLIAEHAALYPVNKDGIKKRKELSKSERKKPSLRKVLV